MLGITRASIGENEGARIIITEGGKKAIKQGAVGGLIFGATIASLAVKRALTGRNDAVQTAAVAQDEVSP